MSLTLDPGWPGRGARCEEEAPRAQVAPGVAGQAGRALSARRSSRDFSGGKEAPWEDSAGEHSVVGGLSWEGFGTGWAVPR